MKIVIETVPHKNQVYNTCGNWMTDADGTVHIYVSETGNDDYNWLIGLHELYEQKLCSKRGISQKVVDAFDIVFEEKRAKSLTLSNAEPGDAPDSPYAKEHCEATGIERIAAASIGVSWDAYEKCLNAL